MNSLEGVMVVGLTGQTGAGKSTVSKVFLQNGFGLIDADQISRLVVQKGSKCLAEIQDCFPACVIGEGGELNRKALGDIIFKDAGKKEMLNSIMYPYIMGHILQEIHRYADMGQKMILLDAPTLFESRADDFCELIISVIAKEPLRKVRIMERDNLTEEQAQARIDSQLPESFFVGHSDFIIKNNKDRKNLNAVAQEVAEKVIDYYRERF
ncbi:MAG: dephospho-CoA kinase [Ruminococcus sp.]|nr:dephospho-CoA kinase [Ruminococcus sp.]